VNVSCPECRSVFRVDPAKVPPTAVRARCSVCGGVITVSSGASSDDEFSSNSSGTVAAARSVNSSERAAPPGRANTGFAAAVMDAFAPPPVAAREAVAPANVVPSISAPEVTRASSTNEKPAPLRTGVPTGQAPPPRQAPPPSIAAPSAATGGQNPPRPVLFPPRPMMPGAGSTGAPSRPLVAPRAAAHPPASAPAPSPPPRPSGDISTGASPASASVRPSAPPASVSNPPAAAPPPAASGATPAATRTPINPFLANDPHAKAKRLARALISDLVTYFPQKRQDGLRDGTLKQLFKEEIQKSYEEYVAQVGKEFAESTPHFQDALNDLLASGQKVF